MLQNALPALFLLVVMVIVAVVLQRYRRNFPGLRSKQGPELTVMSGISIGPQQRLVSVQVGSGKDSTCLILGVAPGGINLLHQIAATTTTSTAEEQSPDSDTGKASEPSGAFARQLANHQGKHEDAS